MQAEVTMRDSSEGSRIVSFQLQQEDWQQVQDLAPYLGAMGHLVVVSADGTTSGNIQGQTNKCGANTRCQPIFIT
jgi:hypothetical protein